MKNLVVVLVLVSFFSAASAQQKNKMTPINYKKIVPGKGVGELVLGISTEKAIEILGNPEKSRSYDEEQAEEVVKFGQNISQEICYNTHYDRVFKYKNDCDATVEYPVYKLYFRNNQLVYMILTSYGYDEEMYSKFSTSGNIKFHSPADKIKGGLGHPEIMEEHYVGEYLYMQSGIDFLTENNEMRAVFIYTPIEGEVAQAIKKESGY